MGETAVTAGRVDNGRRYAVRPELHHLPITREAKRHGGGKHYTRSQRLPSLHSPASLLVQTARPRVI